MTAHSSQMLAQASIAPIWSAIAVLARLPLLHGWRGGGRQCDRRPVMPQLFDRLDANHDGAIAADEVSAENRSLFDRLLRRADANHDKSLSRDEFLASLVPSRPEKPMEAKEPATLPQADAVRYMLLKMDTNRNARIEKDEVPKRAAGRVRRRWSSGSTTTTTARWIGRS